MLGILSRIYLILKSIWNTFLSIQIDALTGIFAAIILMIYIKTLYAFVLGIFGYLIYLRIEKTILQYARLRGRKL